MSQVVGSLHFDRIEFARLEDGVHLHLICTICKRDWASNLLLGSVFTATFDFNEKVSFTIIDHDDSKTAQPCVFSGAKIELFVAVHQDADGVSVCIQRSDAEGVNGIPANWWQRTK